MKEVISGVGGRRKTLDSNCLTDELEEEEGNDRRSFYVLVLTG